MAELPLSQAVDRFKENEGRIDTFVNDPLDAGTYTTSEEVNVKTLPALVADVEQALITGQAQFVSFMPSGTGAASTTVQAKLRESVSVKDFGAVGDGITDDTAAFALAEAASAKVINLAGGTYVVTPYWQNTVSGIFLRKDYVNGKIIAGGREVVMNGAEGAARAGASAPLLVVPHTTKRLALTMVDSNNLYVWRPLGGIYWQRCLLNRSGAGVPFNWNETFLKQVLAYIPVDTGGNSYGNVAGWSLITTGNQSSYINGRARQASVPNEYIEFTYTGGGDLFVVFTGRTSGSYCNVLINGSTEYLILPDDGAGNRYFDTYTASDNQYKQVVQIASGLPQGMHTIRLTNSNTCNSANTSGLRRLAVNALAYDDINIGPWTTGTQARIWATGQSVLKNQECKYDGKFYYATDDGTTGATPPTHTTGSASDGGVTWTYRSTSSYALDDHRIQGTGSQLEYAYQIKPVGAASAEDVGGAAHGNETQTSVKYFCNGTLVSPVAGAWITGESIEVKEEITAWHSQVGGGATPVNLTTLSRLFSRSWIEVKHRHVLQVEAALGWWYSAMWPLLHYNSASGGYRIGITDIWSPCTGSHKCSDYYYDAVTPPYQDDSVAIAKDYLMVATGYALPPSGAVGVPSGGPTDRQFVAWLAVDPASVDFYESGSRTFASKSMNMSNKNPTTGPTSSMICKMYFQRYDGNTPTTVPAGKVIDCRARYGLSISGL